MTDKIPTAEELLEDCEHVLAHFLDSSGPMSTLLRKFARALRERLALEAENKRLAQELNRVTRGDVSDIVPTPQPAKKPSLLAAGYHKPSCDWLNDLGPCTCGQPSQDKRSPG